MSVSVSGRAARRHERPDSVLCDAEGETMFRWEWLLIEGLILALAIVELIRTRRALRRLRAAKTRDPADASVASE